MKKTKILFASSPQPWQWLACTMMGIILLLSWQGRDLANQIELFGWTTQIGLALGLSLSALMFELILRWPPGLPSYKNLFLALCLLVFCLFPWFLPPVERLHLLLFGGLGFCLGRGFQPLQALLLALLASMGDELFQAWLPNRVGDTKDVIINLLAATAALTLARFWGHKVLGQMSPLCHEKP